MQEGKIGIKLFLRPKEPASCHWRIEIEILSQDRDDQNY